MSVLSRRYSPLVVYISYVCFIFIALYIGPLKYIEIDMFLVTLYVFIATIMFSIGYIFGVAKQIYPIEECNRRYELLSTKRHTQYIVNGLLFFGIIVALSSWFEFLRHGSSLSFSSLGRNYIDSYSGYVRGAAVVDLSYVLNIFSHAIIASSLFFASYYFPRFSRYQRYMFFFVCGTYLILHVIGSGKQKYLGDVVICFAVYVAFLKSRSYKKSTTKVLLFILTVGVLIVFLFLEILRQRYMAAGIGIHNIDEVTHPLIYWDHESNVFDVFGDEYGFSLGIFLAYFTNGLYGLSLCLQLPFEWTYFVGNSYSLTRIIEIIIGENGVIAQSTYPVRAAEEFGWGATKWHSLYSWMASDFTFAGVLFIAGLFGYLYGRLWVEAINAKYIASGPLFTMFSLGLVFSLANNQLLHSLSGVIALLFIFLLWGVAKIYRGAFINGSSKYINDSMKG